MAMILLAINACSEDSYLNENSDNQNFKDTMQSELINTSHSELAALRRLVH